MSFVSKLKHMAIKLEQINESVFGYPVEKQERFINHFKEPKDDIERSYFQYLCQMKFNKPIITFGLNIASSVLFFFYLFKGSDTVKEKDNQIKNIFFSNGMSPNIIPDKLIEELGENIDIVNEKKEFLTDYDRRYIYSIWKRYPFSFHFLLKCLLKIRYYSYEIYSAEVKNIIVCNEYSFTSSILTDYCSKHNIIHINVMHGEKIFYMRDSFFRFHRCYVWDEYYKDLFVQLRAAPQQFYIEIPPSLKFKTKSMSQKSVNYTYYLGWESGKQLEIIINILKQLQRKNAIVAIRPHPRYSDIKEIIKKADNIEVENFNTISIEQSLKRTENAIAIYSTVLNQAYSNGIEIVIDDVSDKNKYNSLFQRKYIMLNKPHKLLSTILRE